MTVQELLQRLKKVRPAGPGRWEALCPAHDDHNPSLSVCEGRKGIVLKCHRDCTFNAITNALGVEPRELFYDNGQERRSEIVDTYPYVDEDGELLFEVVRLFPPKTFRQRRPDGHGGWEWSTKGTRRVLYRLHAVVEAVALGKPVYVVEGEKDVHAIEKAGGVATCNPGGAGKWRPEYSAALEGADVVIVADRDGPGRKHAREVAKALEGIAASVELLEPAERKDAADHLDAGFGLEDFRPLGPEDGRLPTYTGPPSNLTETLGAFRSWLHLPDPTPVLAVLGGVAGNLLPGDPVWLGLVAPPSFAKTEILNALSLLRNVHRTATLTPASLLSGTPKKTRAADAKGGLLREIGDFGILVMKDFGSILSLRAEAKAEVLAALREIYDGSWTRHLGTDGGRTLSWEGKVGLIFGATPDLPP